MENTVEVTDERLKELKKMFAPKPLPDYMGVKGIKFMYRGDYATAMIVYKRRHYYVDDIEDLLLDRYREEGLDDTDNNAIDEYLKENALEAAEDLYQSGYYIKIGKR